MPQLGETVTEGTIVTWLVAVGDRVSADDPMVEVSTDKVDSELPSPVDGWIDEILVGEGETVAIGTPLLTITFDEPASGASAPGPSGNGAGARQAVTEAVPAPPSSPVPPPTPGRLGSRTTDDGRFLSPAVRAQLAAAGRDASGLGGSGSNGRITLRDLATAPQPQTQPEPAPIVGRRSEPTVDAGSDAAAATGPTGSPSAEGVNESVIPFDPIRRRTAAHMVASLATSAHTLVVMEVDYSTVAGVRQRFNASLDRAAGAPGPSAGAARPGAVRLTYLAFVAYAVGQAIAEFPKVNARVGDNELIVRHDVHLGIAVDLDHEGLVVPVVRHADRLKLGPLAAAVADLASKAHGRKLKPDDVSGGTFTITNAGGYGTLLTGPVINQPQVAILSTDGVKVQPVALPQPGGGYGLGFHPMGNLCLSFDHRAFDGAYASAFLARVRALLETHEWEAVL